jgi:hypothetical protein
MTPANFLIETSKIWGGDGDYRGSPTKKFSSAKFFLDIGMARANFQEIVFKKISG